MKAIIVEDIDKASELGAIEIRRYPDAILDKSKVGEVAGLACNCPGCGSKGYIPIHKKGEAKPHNHSWQLVRLDPITIHPSVNCTGCCEWHGWLKKGEWIK
jgi:hypothetical protein